MKPHAALPTSLLAAAALLQGVTLPTGAFQVPAGASLVQRPSLSNGPATAGAAFIGRPSTAATTALSASTAGAGGEDPYASPKLDVGALGKYAAAAATELSLFGATFQLVDLALAQFDASLPFPAAFLVFYASSLKSRVFNPLNNARPDRSRAVAGEGSKGFRDRVMPSWTPPGVFFPIMWILIIGPLRAYSSALVVSAAGGLFTLPTMAFIAHLTVGDIWNTINNTEKRYGASVIGVLCVVLSAANAAYQYSTVDPLAGKLLGGTLLWLVTAAALITDTWRLNPLESGERVPLYPVVGEAETSFLWGAKGDE